MNRIQASLSATLVACVTALNPSAASAQTFKSARTLTVDEHAVLDLHLREGERVVVKRVERFEETGSQVLRAKVLDEETAQIREVVIDPTTGAEVSYDDARSREESARRRRYGAADSELTSMLTRSKPDESIRVGLTFDPRREGEVRALLARIGGTVELAREGYLEVIAPSRGLLGLRHSPTIEAMVPARERRKLAVNNAIDMGQPAIAGAHFGGLGNTWLMAVWEPESCINRGHDDFRYIAFQPRPGSSSCDLRGGNHGGIFGHSTAVAGALAANRYLVGKVGLWDAQMVDIDADSNSAEDAMWALEPEIVNASFTITQFDGKRIDEEVYARGTFVFNGAGNDANNPNNCWAYNSLCVGGYSYGSTVGQYADDALWGHSHENLPSGREGPEVVGPAHADAPYYIGDHEYISAHGTSFSTPAVAGTAGLLLATHPFRLWRQPALMRATLMASAQAHPVKDPEGPAVPRFNDGYDDKAGVGAPNGDRASRILADNSYSYRSQVNPEDLGTLATFTVNAWDLVRVVMAWDQCPGYNITQPELNVDFDMVVEGPGKIPALRPHYFNLSAVDNYEVVEFVALAGGTHSIKVSAPNWSPCAAEGGLRQARLALAWTKQPTGGGTKQF
jgi:hypothetical protein